MIRTAIISDIESITKALWDIRHHLKARQIPTRLATYKSSESISEEIRRDPSRWLVCESSEAQQVGFFALSPFGDEKVCKRWRFPVSTVRIEHFACLLSGEILIRQFQLLNAHLAAKSILLCIPSTLRDAYWAALKTGFKLLGESQTILGTDAWLYLDREQKHDEIQTKLRRARIIVA